jgi:hydroxymethylpyrimidine/phosphomethylpyrimidine kinase
VTPPVCLTIAGSDPSGGAGIQADLRAFQAAGVAGTSVITAVLAQNSSGVDAVLKVAPRFIARQIDVVAKDSPVAAVKIGMLVNAQIVSVTAERIARRNLPNVILDPVLSAKDGHDLLSHRGMLRLKTDLLPRALVLTPNAPEAAILSGLPVTNPAEAREAARALHALGARFVLIKGGHYAGEPLDLLYDGTAFLEFPGRRIEGAPVRGTGCLLSASLAAHIALGASVPEAVDRAKGFVARCIADAVSIGKGARVWTGV